MWPRPSAFETTIVAKPLSKPPAGVLREDFAERGDPLAVLAGGTKHAEDCVVEAWQELLSPAFPAGLALLAVGGFGRRELYPHSDVDLLLLVENEPSSQGLKDALSAFLRRLWDGGLRLSHSVRTPGECCEVHDRNIELNISLLDERFLAGDHALYAELEARLPRFLSAQRATLARHLCRLTRTRHAKFGETIYHLEPNVKETPGGLRDFQFVRWLSQLRNARPQGRAPADPLDSLRAAWLCLSQARCYLHFQARRDQNLLSFDAQEEISQLPFVPERDAAAWMRSYYRHARDIHSAATRRMEESESAGSSLLASFRNWRSRLSNAEFTVARDRVYLRNPHRLDQNPEMVLRLFEFVARHGIQPAFDSVQRISGLSPVLERYFSAPRPLWPLLETMLSLPHAALALESMSACGVLKVLFPEWCGIDCLVVRDFYHRYTVDEHTLVSIQEITRLPECSDPLRRRFAGLLSEVEKPGVLLFALLFHDTGKAMGAAVHVRESARLAESAMERIRAPEGLRGRCRSTAEHPPCPRCSTRTSPSSATSWARPAVTP